MKISLQPEGTTSVEQPWLSKDDCQDDGVPVRMSSDGMNSVNLKSQSPKAPPKHFKRKGPEVCHGSLSRWDVEAAFSDFASTAFENMHMRLPVSHFFQHLAPREWPSSLHPCEKLVSIAGARGLGMQTTSEP